jgi:hypothetical protein
MTSVEEVFRRMKAPADRLEFTLDIDKLGRCEGNTDHPDEGCRIFLHRDFMLPEKRKAATIVLLHEIAHACVNMRVGYNTCVNMRIGYNACDELLCEEFHSVICEYYRKFIAKKKNRGRVKLYDPVI